ncbi:hypothetical protein [Streptosporangium sp. G12]
MTALASTVDAVRLGYTLPAGEAEALLRRASARIRRAARQHISSITSTVRVRVEDGTAVLLGNPITAVTSVTQLAEDGGAAVTGWRWDGRDRIHGINTSPTTTLPAWACWPTDVMVTYTHGWTTIPDELLDLVCSVAARIGSVPASGGMEAGVRSESIDDYSVTYAVEALDAASGLLPGEEAELRAFLGSPPSAYAVRTR